MKKDDETKFKGKIKNKTDIKNKVDLLEDVEGDWEIDPQSNEMTVTFSGKIKEDGMGKGGLSAADKAWIAGLIRPIQKDVSEIKERLTNVENRLDIVEQDIKTLKKDVKAIKECPTIKKELKKDDE